MKKISYFLIFSLLLACKQENKQRNENEKISEKNNNSKDINIKNKKLVEKELVLSNGIKINFYKIGNGEKIENYDVIKIDYKVKLKDGTIVDGNHLLNKKYLPFIIGFTMQTPGWDLALQEMKIGDEAEIYLPAKLARGEIGIKGLIPPNSDNYIEIKILGKMSPTKTIDGTKVWLLEENKSESLKAGLENIIDFHYMVSSPSNPRYDISYRKNTPYSFKFSDFGIVKGLKKALLGVKKSDKLWVFIPPSQAYGNKGMVNLIKPNEPIFYDLFIMDVR